MSSEDLKSLHDVYEGLNVEEECQKTTYILQFLWRDLTSSYDVFGPYFTLPSTMRNISACTRSKIFLCCERCMDKTKCFTSENHAGT